MEMEFSEHLAKGMVAAFYAAGAGHASWSTALGLLKAQLRARRVEIVVQGRMSDVESFWINDRTPLTRGLHELLATSPQPLELAGAKWLQAPVGQWFVGDASAGLWVVNLLRDDVQQVMLAVWSDVSDAYTVVGYDNKPMRFLLWHLTKAFDIFLKELVSRRLGESALDVLNHLRRPAWLIDRSRRIQFQNSPAKQMVAEAEFLTERFGTLRCACEGDDCRLSAALHTMFEDHSAGEGGTGLANERFLMRVPGTAAAQEGVTVHGRALSADRDDQGVDLALLVACRPDRPVPIDPKWISDALCLTPAEARVAVGLAQGHSLNSMSTTSGLSIFTLRSQAHSAMTKTGCHRQIDLISLVHRTQKAQQVDDAVDF